MRHFVHIITLFTLYSSGLLFSQSCPVVSTYFGKLQTDEFKGVCLDAKGNIYAFGNTYNTDLPVTAGAFQQTSKGDYENFLIKMDSCGNLIWCTYFGTSGFDDGYKLMYSPADSSIVFTGYTDGTDLPVTTSCFQSTNAGNYDAFLAKFNLNGQPRWITYFGANQADLSFDLAIDNYANIIIGGTSLSPTLYTNAQSFQPALVGAVDAFIAKFDMNGNFKFSTFYGGSNAEDIHRLSTDKDRNIIACGGSFSNNLSTTANCFQPSSNGGMEIYLIKFDSIGNRVFSTYVGGSSVDDCYGALTDSLNNIILTGQTESTDFYYTAVSQQTTIAGNADLYAMKFTPTGSLMWSTIIGGTDLDLNINAAMDESENIFILGNSQSVDFPMTGSGNYTVNEGSNDIVLVKLNPNGNTLYSTYKGGSGDDTPGDLVLGKNKVFVAGLTASPNFPVIAGNYQMTNAGQEDGYITTIVLPVNIHTGISDYRKEMKCLKTIGSELTISCDEIKEIEIYDALGRLVLKQNVYETLDLSELKAYQVYFIMGLNQNGEKVSADKFYKTY